MIGLLKFILIAQLRRPKLAAKNGGFTLIEVIVAMVLAVIVLIPLLGFAINILDTDRTEQAKSTSDAEIQSALDYIGQDLQQAVYMYDAAGIKAIQSQLPDPGNTSRVPVLVFWKRDIKPKIVPIGTGTNCTTTPDKCDDAFVYSLVVYYLIDSGSSQSTWAKNAYQIGRFQLNGGVKNPSGKAGTPNEYYTSAAPDTGYKSFDLSSALDTLQEKMNSWKNSGVAYTANQKIASVLIDYVDKTPVTQDTSKLTPSDCTKVLKKPDTVDGNYTQDQLKVPAYAGANAYVDSSNAVKDTGSFYACVDSNTNTARVFIRGNAKARLNSFDVKYNANAVTYFPTSSVQVQGRGSLANLQ